MTWWVSLMLSCWMACGSKERSQPAVQEGPELEVARDDQPIPDRGRRLVAIGDLHGDLPQARKALQLASLIDEEDRWIGGDAILVQTGDVVDRGPDSGPLIELFDSLEDQAEAQGGRVVALVGNHEVMNLMGDWRYVHPGDVESFGGMEAREQAFRVEGRMGARLLELPMVAVVQGSVFAHGGVTPEAAERGLEYLNALPRSVLGGERSPRELGEQSPLWYRGYVQDPEQEACPRLEQALQTLGARRMVVGHTTQRDGKIAARCGGQLLVIDTGIASHYGGMVSALELRGSEARALYPSETVLLPSP